MAYGIDSMAHKIALREQGNTIGVNAGGYSTSTPREHRLIHQIMEKGCVISEFALDTVPRPFYFPIRNRIIAGISKAVLVGEAAFQSGSLITARLGLEQNRDIFAFPGRIDSPSARAQLFNPTRRQTGYVRQRYPGRIRAGMVCTKKSRTMEFSKRKNCCWN